MRSGRTRLRGSLRMSLRIRKVQLLRVFEERQRLIADQARERRALQQPIAGRYRFDRREESRGEIPRPARRPRAAAAHRIIRRRQPRIAAGRLHVRGDQRALAMVMLAEVIRRHDRQIGGSGEVAHHHVAPGLVVHRELAVPQPIRHRRLDVLPARGPFDGVTGAEIHDAAFAGLVIRQLQFAAHVLGEQPQHRRLRRRRDRRQFIEKDDDQVALFGELARVSRPRHRQQPHAVGCRDREAAEILRLADRADEDDDLALDAGARRTRLRGSW